LRKLRIQGTKRQGTNTLGNKKSSRRRQEQPAASGEAVDASLVYPSGVF
jgi:hypothetical protein